MKKYNLNSISLNTEVSNTILKIGQETILWEAGDSKYIGILIPNEKFGHLVIIPSDKSDNTLAYLKGKIKVPKEMQENIRIIKNNYKKDFESEYLVEIKDETIIKIEEELDKIKWIDFKKDNAYIFQDNDAKAYCEEYNNDAKEFPESYDIKEISYDNLVDFQDLCEHHPTKPFSSDNKTPIKADFNISQEEIEKSLKDAKVNLEKSEPEISKGIKQFMDDIVDAHERINYFENMMSGIKINSFGELYNKLSQDFKELKFESKLMRYTQSRLEIYKKDDTTDFFGNGLFNSAMLVDIHMVNGTFLSCLIRSRLSIIGNPLTLEELYLQISELNKWAKCQRENTEYNHDENKFKVSDTVKIERKALQTLIIESTNLNKYDLGSVPFGIPQDSYQQQCQQLGRYQINSLMPPQMQNNAGYGMPNPYPQYSNNLPQPKFPDGFFSESNPELTAIYPRKVPTGKGGTFYYQDINTPPFDKDIHQVNNNHGTCKGINSMNEEFLLCNYINIINKNIITDKEIIEYKQKRAFNILGNLYYLETHIKDFDDEEIKQIINIKSYRLDNLISNHEKYKVENFITEYCPVIYGYIKDDEDLKNLTLNIIPAYDINTEELLMCINKGIENKEHFKKVLLSLN